MPVVDTVVPAADHRASPATDPALLNAAVTAIVDALGSSRTACIVPGILVSRAGLADKALAVVNASNLPFTTMFMDKCVLDESHPNYIGMYDGKLMNERVCAFVEGCDCVMGIGAMLTDFNSGSFTARIDRSKSINIMPRAVRVGNASYDNVRMEDVLTELARRIPRKEVPAPAVQGLEAPVGNLDGPVTAGYLYPRWQQMLKPNDIVIAETGTTSMGLGFAHMPKGATFQNQTLWGAIGWATPAAFGAAIAAPHRRTILITGEGSHQLTAQEVSQFHRFGLKPIIFVLNNDGYLVEKLLCKNPESYYNDLAQWNYSKLPEAMGCDGWFTARVTTCAELDQAIATAESCGTGAYIEVIAGRYEASPLSMKLHQSVDTLYSA
ncbi:thiamine pyrophosphate-dependent enzyme [Paraburkholderia dioscoreae]